jgi:RNase H-fold protein (predicted Holliday junction resolvase)
MKGSLTNYRRLLALDPSAKGFGFVVLEGEELLDWGVRGPAGNKNKERLRKVARLIDRYQPDVVVFEQYDRKTRRRTSRTKKFIRQVRMLAKRKRIQSRAIPQSEASKTLALSGANKYEIAVEIANRFPELSSRLPRRRKPWMSEDESSSIFDAAKLSLVFLHRNNEVQQVNAASGDSNRIGV